MNPKQLRLKLGLTQKQLADQAYVSRQVVILTEAGVYTPMPAALMRVLAPVAGSEEAVLTEYKAMQRKKRYDNGPVARQLLESGRIHNWIEFRENWRNGSVSAVCKDLCIPLSTWQNIENGGSDGFVRSILKDDCGIEFPGFD